jgi:hypothetical protein
VEASRNLKVGLTVLKKKCREFGIARWPHRKIKSLDSLIQDLQVFFSFPFLMCQLLLHQVIVKNYLQNKVKLYIYTFTGRGKTPTAGE